MTRMTATIMEHYPCISTYTKYNHLLYHIWQQMGEKLKLRYFHYSLNLKRLIVPNASKNGKQFETLPCG